MSKLVQLETDLWYAVNIKKKMWFDFQWDNSPQETKMTQKLTTIGHRIAFNNEQSPYHIISYKRTRNDNEKKSNEKTNCLIYIKNERKTNM